MDRARATGAIPVSAAAILAAALLYYSLQGVEWAQVATTIARADYWLLALVSGLASVTLFLRAYRWRVLLRAQGAVEVSTAFWATAAGYFGNNFLPARAGELVRTYLIASQTSLTGTYVLTTALAERLADAIALVAVCAVVLVNMPSQAEWVIEAARVLAVVGLLGAIAIAVLPRLGATAAWAARLPLPRSWRPGFGRTVGHVLDGLRTFHDPRRISVFSGLTLVIWTLDVVGTVVGAHALGLEMPGKAALLLLTGLGLGSALPSTPGYVGIYQFVAVTVLMPFGFRRSDAIAYIVVAQAFQYVVIGVWGGLGLLRYRRALRSKESRTPPTSEAV